MASARYPSRPRSFLPRDPRVAEPYRLTAQLAFRIGILGALALAAFALLILRLWALQVLSGDEYRRVAKNNQLRLVRTEAPRGLILDRNGKILVRNRGATAVRIWPADLPEKGRYQAVKRLAQVLGVPLQDVLEQLEDHKDDPLTPITVRENVPASVVMALSERQTLFPFVRIEDTSVRQYPLGELGSQLLGHVGEIDELQLDELKGYRLGDRIGQRGVEATYDRFLRGRPGVQQVRFDSAGRTIGRPLTRAEPVAGDSVRLTLDTDLQRAAEEAVHYGISLAHDNENWYAETGAAVALDSRSGEVLALASVPTYHPGVYSNPRRREGLGVVLDQPRGVAARENFPGINRAIQGLYAPGSTWKPVTALAAMQEGILGAYEPIDCPASFSVKDSAGNPVVGGQFNNWNGTSSGLLTLPQALEQSCDTYFYALGMRFYSLPGDRGHPFQEWAAHWGFGRPAGLDIGGESSGLLPTPEWRKRTYTKKTLPCCWQEERSWKPGDSIQLAIGQKDLLVTPLQMASFYSTVANNGNMIRPHLLRWIEESGTQRSNPLVLRRYSSPPAGESRMDPGALAAVQQGLLQATHGNQGTSTAVFSSFPELIAGKTGTAQKYVAQAGDLIDTSWFCGYGPYDSPEITVCVVIENGGFGGEAAAPAALKIFQAYFKEQGGSLTSVPAD